MYTIRSPGNNIVPFVNQIIQFHVPRSWKLQESKYSNYTLHLEVASAIAVKLYVHTYIYANGGCQCGGWIGE